jgi:hypothetical protein
MSANESIKVLLMRSKLALGSLSLVEKQLLDICTVLTELQEFAMLEPIRGEEKNSDKDFFISPPLSVYDEADPDEV